MAFNDNTKLTDRAIAAMTRGVKSQDLPLHMLCPAKHQVERHLFTFSTGPTIPYYPCKPCEVVYRYHECTLIPGDEGFPE